MIVGHCFCLLLAILFSSFAYAEPVTKDRISFSLPFGSALADKLKPGLKVVLLGKEICKAKTGATFIHKWQGVEPGNFQATHLLGFGKCDLEQVNVAIIGVDADSIGVILPQEIPSAVPKAIELEARRQLLARDAKAPKLYSYAPLSHGLPKNFRVKEGVLLNFAWKDEGNGPSVWVVNNKVFLLPGVCRAVHKPFTFFTIGDRLFLAYRAAGCCRCGDKTFYVYDLSGSEPKKLYENSKLGD
jgi:hypothetical protein